MGRARITATIIVKDRKVKAAVRYAQLTVTTILMMMTATMLLLLLLLLLLLMLLLLCEKVQPVEMEKARQEENDLERFDLPLRVLTMLCRVTGSALSATT